MTDIVTPEKRSLMMANIKGKNTKPELMIRRALHRLGFRYRLHQKDLSGKPDIVLPKYKAVIFVQGCLWHGHDCHLFKWPHSNADFWKAKITRNQEIDRQSAEKLKAAGWRVGTIWECALKGKTRRPFVDVIEACRTWLFSAETLFNIRGFL